jgi:hypothetical protein
MRKTNIDSQVTSVATIHAKCHGLMKATAAMDLLIDGMDNERDSEAKKRRVIKDLTEIKSLMEESLPAISKEATALAPISGMKEAMRRLTNETIREQASKSLFNPMEEVKALVASSKPQSTTNPAKGNPKSNAMPFPRPANPPYYTKHEFIHWIEQ